MKSPDENVQRAIKALKQGGQSMMFSTIVDWLKVSNEKETHAVIYEKEYEERLMASGRCQELRFILKHIEMEYKE